MKRLVAMALAILIVPAVAGATTTHKTTHHHAKVSLDSAKATAQAKVPDGQLVSHEMETEHGKTIYSFEFKVPNKSGVDEVNVDAMTGKVVGGVHHESPKQEQKEDQQKSPNHS
jgi:uncharacterized membrane protein YkoI